MIADRIAKLAFVALLLASSAFGQDLEHGRSSTGSAPGLLATYEAAVDTFRLLVQHGSLPNSAAADSGWVRDDSYYDAVIEADDGSAVRWGATCSATPDIPIWDGLGIRAGYAYENNAPAPVRHAFVWFDISAIPADSKVESAYILINTQKWQTIPFQNGGSLRARADTVSSDYAMLGSGSGDTGDGSDHCFLNVSDSMVNNDTFSSWFPTLASRDDRHDFGPLGIPFEPGVAVGPGQAMQVDVAIPIQQIIDAGTQSRGVIFHLYFVGTSAAQFSFMAGDEAAKITSGNPALICSVSSERGPKPWNTTHVPVVFGADDGYDDHSWMAHEMTSRGHPWVEYATYSRFGEPGRLSQTQWDSLITHPLVDFVMHSRTHEYFGTMDEHRLDYDLARDYTTEMFTDPPDTSRFLDFAWPGAPTDGENYSILAISRMVENGWRSCRAVSGGWSEVIGEKTRAGLDSFVNLYAIQTYAAPPIFGEAGCPQSPEHIREKITDWIDDCVVDYGRSPLSLFVHYPGSDGCDYASFVTFIEIVESIPNVDFMSWDDMISWRLQDSDFFAPANLAMASDAPCPIRTSAAMYDSVLSTVDDANMSCVWIGPQGQSAPTASAIDEGPCRSSVRAAHAAPNPANPGTWIHFSAQGTGSMSIGIYDIAGHRLNCLHCIAASKGNQAVFWDGLDKCGCPLASGTYLIRAEGADTEALGRVTLVR